MLEFVRERGEVHPREVEAQFAHGAVRNYWGGSSNATTHLLDGMHYRGLLRVTRRDSGIRVYAVREQTARRPPIARRAVRATRRAGRRRRAQIHATAALRACNRLVRRLRYGAPQLRGELESALARAKRRLAHARVDGIDWYWPEGEDPKADRGRDGRPRAAARAVRSGRVGPHALRDVLEAGRYRFEAYTPPAKRKLGYYALPLLWRDEVMGWGTCR